MKHLKFIIASVMLLAAGVAAFACSRVVYLGDNGIVLAGRTLDWRTPIPTNVYVYPKGIAKESMPSGPRLEWVSKYGSVLAVGYDGGVTEGMNEKGLAMGGLFCKTSSYKTADGSDSTPVVSLAVLVSYFLDNFATVDEVENWLRNNEFGISGKTFDGGTVSLLHWAVTDKSGTTLLMEYVDGKLNLYKGRELQVLTNDPPYPQMEAINKYWQAVGGANMLPGTVRSSDRFARADFFIKHVPTNFEYAEALGCLSSIMGTVSVPYGYEIVGEPNISSTQWMSICDISGGKYYLKFADSTGDFWIDLARLRLGKGAPILKLDTSNHVDLMGCANDKLKKSPGFTPMW